jgi:hypothetical protein
MSFRCTKLSYFKGKHSNDINLLNLLFEVKPPLTGKTFIYICKKQR